MDGGRGNRALVVGPLKKEQIRKDPDRQKKIVIQIRQINKNTEMEVQKYRKKICNLIHNNCQKIQVYMVKKWKSKTY